MIDFEVQNHGSIFLLIPHTEAAVVWVADHLPEEALNFGLASYVVEHRYIRDIVTGIIDDGLTVQ